MNRKNLFTALACALLVLSLLGCGTTRELRSIQLSRSNTDPNAGTGVILFPDAPVQMYTWGNYSNGQQKLLNGVGGAIGYQIALTPGSVAGTGTLGNPNATPPETVQLSPTGLLTPVVPFAVCTFENVAVPPATSPAFQTTGSYTLTATYQGFTSPPSYIGVATAGGIVDTTNPEGLCTTPPGS